MANCTLQDLVQAVKDHAVKNYETGGWDYVVECWEDADIANEIAGSVQTPAGAIMKVGKIVKILNDNRRDVMAEIF